MEQAQIQSENNWLPPYSLATTEPVGISCLKVWYWNIQGPQLGQTTDNSLPTFAYIVPPSTVIAS